jgi:hypothetical protein
LELGIKKQKIVHETLSKKILHKNRTDGVAQGKVPEFKSQYCKKKKKKKEKHFLFSMQEMGAKTQNGSPHLLALYWRAGVIHVTDDC